MHWTRVCNLVLFILSAPRQARAPLLDTMAYTDITMIGEEFPREVKLVYLGSEEESPTSA
jgi:hypothetical protein